MELFRSKQRSEAKDLQTIAETAGLNQKEQSQLSLLSKKIGATIENTATAISLADFSSERQRGRTILMKRYEADNDKGTAYQQVRNLYMLGKELEKPEYDTLVTALRTDEVKSFFNRQQEPG